MKQSIAYSGGLCLLLILSACTHTDQDHDVQESLNMQSSNQEIVEEELGVRNVDFTAIEKSFLFSGEISSDWEVQYREQSDAINIYDPSIAQDLSEDAENTNNSLEQSQIFIKKFKANDFLTLSTVDIDERVPQVVHGRNAVAYNIVKKSTAASFIDQPLWRNEWHQVLDIRYSADDPSIFYVFAYHPDLDPEIFRTFIDALIFANDRSGDAAQEVISTTEVVPPLSDAQERVTKKPFGIFIDPENSPVQPERFRGYHSGTDFEIFDDERDADVSVYAICDGEILSAQRVGGYGGVITQACTIDGESVRVLYGHVSMGNSLVRVGDAITAGEEITLLGKAESEDTDGERKHLHIGITRGPQVDVRGYVDRIQQLQQWRDFEKL